MTEPNAEPDDSDLSYIERLALADPDTTLGKLQRGRGAGWLECLELPREEAHDLLWQSITADPRLDHQVESRGDYYATLAQRTKFDVRRLLPEQLPIEEVWRDSWLVYDVLSRLDEMGVRDAGAVLLAHIGPNDQQNDYVFMMACPASNATIARIPATVVERRDDENLVGTVRRWFHEFPWESWANDQPRIEAALREVMRRRSVEQPRPRRTPPPMSAPLSEILDCRWPRRNVPPAVVQRLTTDLRPGEREELIAGCSSRRDPGLPFAIFGITNDPAGLPAATIIADETAPDPASKDTSPYARQGAVYRYLRALRPEHTLPLARQWLGTGAGRDSYACDILGLHAEPADIPGVRARLGGAWKQRKIGHICDLLDALGRQPQLGPFPELSEIFDGIEYSYARWRAAMAMAANDPTFSTTLARECLWDSSEGVREVAVSAAAILDQVAEARREELRADQTDS